MDELDELFDDKPRYTPRQMKTIREIERRSQDLIRVLNPTQEDFFLLWNRVRFKVPAITHDEGHGLGQAILPRYLAVNYVKAMVDKILSEAVVKLTKAENERRVKNGMAEMDKHSQQPAFEGQYKINDPSKRSKVIQKIWLGVEQEYGIYDESPDIQEQPAYRTDEQMVEALNRPAKRLENPTQQDNPFATTPQTAPEAPAEQESPNIPIPAQELADAFEETAEAEEAGMTQVEDILQEVQLA